MLVLSRKINEKIVLSNGVTVTLVAIHGNQVRLGFEAPPAIRVYRAELLEGKPPAAALASAPAAARSRA